ncbi:hypothetical protein ACIQW5_18655 [Methylorubrum thiocyanatum]|uniref:hypothetical protein n=1 Tax=Methylorubrum thiocyanatum TaxID=47958 RepID=UPI00383ACEAC
MTAQPSREILQETLNQLIEADNQERARHPSGNLNDFVASQFCCTLFWDDTTNKLDESFTVTSAKMCKDLADKHGGKRRPLLPGACR